MRLNLLDDEAKKRIDTQIIKIELTNSAILLTMVVIISSVLLFAAQKYLSYQSQRVTLGNGDHSEDIQVDKTNQAIEQLELMQKDYLKWSVVLKDILTLIPRGVKLNQLTVDKDTRQMTLSGSADTRSDYLTLEEKLRTAPSVVKVNAPVSNLLKQKDIIFTLETTLKF